MFFLFKDHDVEILWGFRAWFETSFECRNYWSSWRLENFIPI